MELDKRIGEKLKRIRKEKGYSTRKVGEKIGISYSYISRIENGKIPSLSTLQKLCDFYGIDIKSLFGEHQEPTQELKDMGVEWIRFVEDMENEKMTPEEIKKFVEAMKAFKNLS